MDWSWGFHLEGELDDDYCIRGESRGILQEDGS